MSGTLSQDMMHRPHHYSLFQALFLLQELDADSARLGSFDTAADKVERIRLRGSASLSFPAGHVESVQLQTTAEGEDLYEISTSMASLYGALSPLPTAYTAALVGSAPEGAEERERQRDFLDLFNHRLLSLAYCVDLYRHVHRTAGTALSPVLWEAVLALCGLLPVDRARPAGAVATGASLVSQRLMAVGTRSSGGLVMWLKEHFPIIDFSVVEHTSDWVEIPRDEQAVLGVRNCHLGAVAGSPGFTLGSRLIDVETKFRVEVGPVGWDDFLSLLPGAARLTELTDLIDRYAPDWLRFDIRLRLYGPDCRNLRVHLDGKETRLGLTSGLFSQDGARDDLALTFDPEALMSPHEASHSAGAAL